MERILLTHWRAPGDTVCMTACVRDLAVRYPERYEIHIAGSCPTIWDNNPYVEKVWGPRPPRGISSIRLNCQRERNECDRIRLHYITAFHRSLGSKLGVDVPVLYPKGDLHLSEDDRNSRPVADRYWLLIAGGKNDMPAKVWSAGRFQQVVSSLRKEGIKCVQGGAVLPGHRHPRLNDVVSFVGQLDLRGFLRLAYHADGVICPVTFAMHVAAAFDKR